MRPSFRLVMLALLALVAAASSCAGGGRHAVTVPANGCAPPQHEALDSRSTVHLFPGAVTPSYLTDPPTSGPHRLGPPYTGVVTSPIPRPSQVAMLESGYVLVQSASLTQSPTLDALAGNLVTVAPPVAPLPAPVVVTAWTWKLECGSLAPPALAAIGAFIAAHRGVGFAGNIPVTTS